MADVPVLEEDSETTIMEQDGVTPLQESDGSAPPSPGRLWWKVPSG